MPRKRATGNKMTSKPHITIRSGGQTGADRAALDWAISKGVPHCGWCPRGRIAEDGILNSKYHLLETETKNYPERTRKNVEDADGTVLFSISNTLTGGTLLTQQFAQRFNKPWLHLHPSLQNPAQSLQYFIERWDLRDINIAGPRLSTEPNICKFVEEVLNETFGEAVLHK